MEMEFCVCPVVAFSSSLVAKKKGISLGQQTATERCFHLLWRKNILTVEKARPMPSCDPSLGIC